MPPAIEVDHVTKEFRLGQLTSLGQNLRNAWRRVCGQPVEEPAPFKALDQVSFTVEQGEVLGIIGHNGAGKSTLLKILAGISQPTRGSVRVHGRVAPLIEVGAGLMPEMTGRENIFLNASILGMSRAEIRRKFDEIVAFSELEEFIDTPVKYYSTGMYMRLAFSLATAVHPDILVLDEIFAGGDAAFMERATARMHQMIDQANIMIMVSHDHRLVSSLCNRVIWMDHGRLVRDGAPDEVIPEYLGRGAHD